MIPIRALLLAGAMLAVGLACNANPRVTPSGMAGASGGSPAPGQGGTGAGGAGVPGIQPSGRRRRPAARRRPGTGVVSGRDHPALHQPRVPADHLRDGRLQADDLRGGGADHAARPGVRSGRQGPALQRRASTSPTRRWIPSPPGPAATAATRRSRASRSPPRSPTPRASSCSTTSRWAPTSRWSSRSASGGGRSRCPRSRPAPRTRVDDPQPDAPAAQPEGGQHPAGSR